MTVRIILTLNLFYKPLCIIKSSDQDLTESELLYLFQANEPFLIFRDSFYEFADSRKPVFQGFPVCSVADSHGMRFFEAVAKRDPGFYGKREGPDRYFYRIGCHG